MKRLIILFLVLLASGVACAETPITGAFGLKFGEAVDDTMALHKEKDGYSIYAFAPDFKLKPFTDYFVHVTPVKHLIYEIEAIGYSEGSCYLRYLALKDVLTKKYGAGKEGSQFKRWYWYRHKEGKPQQKIFLDCEEYTDSGLVRLYYTDFIIRKNRMDELVSEAEAEAGNL